MSRIFPFPPLPADNADDAVAPQREAIAKAIMVLLDGLAPSERERLLQQITDAIRPIPAPRAGEVLGAIIRLLPRRPEWTVDDIKRQVEAEGVQARAKEIYNALGYLTRKGHVRRVGYGRYLIDGVSIVTSDNLGGEPTRNDDDG